MTGIDWRIRVFVAGVVLFVLSGILPWLKGVGWVGAALLILAALVGWLAPRRRGAAARAGGGPAPARRPKRAGPAAEPRQVNILMLGFSGSGKTLMLAGLFSRFRFGGSSGITMYTDNDSERELEQLVGRIQDTEDDFLPEATQQGDPRTWSFGIRVDLAHGKRADAFTVNYLDYAGEYAAALAGADGEVNEAFLAALKDTDILMGVLDGEEVRSVLLDRGRRQSLIRIERLLRLLVRTDQRCVHLVISKWDALVDRDGRQLGLDEVVSRLEQVSANFRDFRLNPRFNTVRIIPVSTFGRGFAKQGEDGRLVKQPGAQWNPTNVDFPFYCAIPDILTGDVALMSANAADRDNRTALSKERLARMTLAVFELADIVLKVTTHGLLVTVPFSAIIEQVRKSLPRWLNRGGSERFDGNAALARVLEQCYAKTTAFNEQWYVHPAVDRSR